MIRKILEINNYQLYFKFMEKDITINELARMVSIGFHDLEMKMNNNTEKLDEKINLLSRQISGLQEDVNDLQAYKANYVSRFEFQRLENRVEVLEDGE